LKLLHLFRRSLLQPGTSNQPTFTASRLLFRTPLDPIDNHDFGHTNATDQHRPEFKSLPYLTPGGEDIASRLSRRRLWYYEYTMFTALGLMMRVNARDLMSKLTTGRARKRLEGRGYAARTFSCDVIVSERPISPFHVIELYYLY